MEFTWASIFRALGVMLLIYLISKLFTPLLAFKPYFDWWRRLGGSQYHSCIDLAALAYWNYFPLYYYIRILTTSETARFQSPGWAYFISNLLTGGAQGVVPGGTLTPRNICATLVPETPPTDPDLLGKWPTQSDSGGDSGTDKTKWGWRRLMADWAGVEWPAIGKPWVPNEQAWAETPDNFLAKNFAIPSSSPLVIGYVMNTHSYNGNTYYPLAMEPLVGITTGPIGSGGWWGFLQHGDGFGGWGLDQIQSYIWSSDVPTNWSGGAGSASRCDPFSAMSSGLSLAIGSAMLAGAEGPVGPLFLLGGLLGGSISAAGSGCFG